MANLGSTNIYGNLNVTGFINSLNFNTKVDTNCDIGGTGGSITTYDFINILKEKGAFDTNFYVCRGSWSYKDNKTITDTDCGDIHLAGSTIQVISNDINSYTVIIHTATTTTNEANPGLINGDFIYVYNGETYSPGWRRLLNTKVDNITSLSNNETEVENLRKEIDILKTQIQELREKLI